MRTPQDQLNRYWSKCIAARRCKTRLAVLAAFLRAHFVPTQAEVERTMERIGVQWATWHSFEGWSGKVTFREFLAVKAGRSPDDLGFQYDFQSYVREKRMRAMG